MRTFAKNRNIRMITDFTHFLSSMGIVPKDTTDESTYKKCLREE